MYRRRKLPHIQEGGWLLPNIGAHLSGYVLARWESVLSLDLLPAPTLCVFSFIQVRKRKPHCVVLKVKMEDVLSWKEGCGAHPAVVCSQSQVGCQRECGPEVSQPLRLRWIGRLSPTAPKEFWATRYISTFQMEIEIIHIHTAIPAPVITPVVPHSLHLQPNHMLLCAGLTENHIRVVLWGVLGLKSKLIVANRNVCSFNWKVNMLKCQDISWAGRTLIL